MIKSRVQLAAMKLNSDIQAGNISEFEGMDQMIDLVLEICKGNPEISKDWLLDNTSIDMLTAFFEAAGTTGNKGEPPGEPGKN
jgi:hypothetical protein